MSIISPASADPSPPRTSRWRRIDWIAYLIIAAAVSLPVAVILIRQQRFVPPADQWRAALDEKGKLRPVADVVRVTRQLKLVTVAVESNVRATMTDSLWRGTASA